MTRPTTRPCSPPTPAPSPPPTAALHFTPALLTALHAAGIRTATITLHVGAGTFLPVRDTPETHRIHAERGRITPEAADAINAASRIVAVGTTSLRLLESAADDRGRIHPFDGDTTLFLKPGHRFRTASALLTNFHLPKSTLFMLGLRIRRHRPHARRLRPRHRRQVSILQLWGQFVAGTRVTPLTTPAASARHARPGCPPRHPMTLPTP